MTRLRTVLALFCLVTPSLWADTGATLAGRITDPNGALVPGAKIEATNTETSLKRGTESNKEGVYVLSDLVPGRYRIQVQAQGFETVIQENVVLRVQDIVTQNYSLKVGAVATSVTVEGGAPMVQQESAAVSTVVDRRSVENMPLNGRSLQSLITLTPGVVLTPQLTGQFNVNGQRSTANYFSVDGVSANVGIEINVLGPTTTGAGTSAAFNALGATNGLISLDALEEFRIQTATFSAEYGRTPGGQISMATRSGTQQWHGSVSEYLRNDAFDAANWFVNASALHKPSLRQNDFGGTLGGPVPLLRRLTKAASPRTFFFLAYEGTLLRTPSAGILTVPSLALRQQVSPALQVLLNSYPVPTQTSPTDGVGLLPYSYSNPASSHTGSARIDHYFTDRVASFFRVNLSPSESDTRFLNRVVATRYHLQTYTGGVSAIWSPHITSDLRLNYSTNSAISKSAMDDWGGAVVPDPSVLFQPPYSPAHTPPYSIKDAYWSLATLLFSGGLTQGQFITPVQRQWNLTGSTVAVRGRHQIKAGFDWREMRPDVLPRLLVATASFNNVASFRNARVDTMTFTTNQEYRPVFGSFSSYVQDRFKATARLSIDAGLRWDINFAPTDAGGLKFTVLSDPASLATTGVATNRTAPYSTRMRNFAPRLGVAYSLIPTRGHELVIRAGGGIFYDLGFGNVISIFTGYPFSNTVRSLSAPFPLPVSQLVLPSPPNPNPPYPGTIFGFDRRYRTPYTIQWSAAVEQALGVNQKISVTAIRSTGRDLVGQSSYTGLNPGIGTVSRISNLAWSNYNALQVQLQRRLTAGLQVLLSYNWSNSIDVNSAEVATVFLVKGPSDFDIRHVFSGAVSYDVPFASRFRWAKAVLSHWSIDTIVKAQSPYPQDGIQGSTVINFQSGSVRMDYLGGPAIIEDPNVPGGKKFNRAAFKAPAPGTLGTLGRNALRVFPVSEADVSLRRQFALSEHTRLSFRADAFNVLNHPNFGGLSNPINVTGQAATMLSTSTSAGGGLNPLYGMGGPRSMQLSVNVKF